MENSRKSKRYQFVINLIMMIITLFIILPFVLVFISSITDENVLIRNGYSFFPKKLSLYAYQYIIRQGEKIVRAYGVTILVTCAGTILNLAMSSLLAYPLSVKTLPHRRALTFFIFFTMLFNGGLVPTYLMYVNYIHIKNTIWALIVPNLLLSANNVLMIRSYFMTSIPDALFEAAKIDGAGHVKIFSTIVLPLGKPILVTMGLFSGLAYWNDWTNGLYYLSGNQGQKLYGIQNLLNQMITDIQYLASGKVAGNIGAEVAKLPTTSIRMAIAFIAMLPLFIIYPFLQKYFSEGITLGAVKG
ncbi:putative aldouronate transport system permease protein [Lachnotalea glycerini]|uniref:Carbohydrate ABC transporter permease n=1 Tax=Lachnotalea glycerini TaxID=1763509 RepID=A0A255I0Y6_9FIRM|nr:carbohydrate ABC transporter permease [Lachnotalea glycerini]PXV85380.1 putative aldouronate transport system permease protein [Lachnotalea glycerini]RDY29855.1 carbohydrate ABC transporter permease [Lachnotalea glycerini]